MQDIELLELAAKAAGYQIEWVRNSGCFYRCGEEIGREQWDPLEDDGDALRLAVKLRMKLDMFVGYCSVSFDDQKGGEGEVEQDDGDDGDLDDFAVTRRAIVRAAAEIGKNS